MLLLFYLYQNIQLWKQQNIWYLNRANAAYIISRFSIFYFNKFFFRGLACRALFGRRISVMHITTNLAFPFHTITSLQFYMQQVK